MFRCRNHEQVGSGVGAWTGQSTWEQQKDIDIYYGGGIPIELIWKRLDHI